MTSSSVRCFAFIVDAKDRVCLVTPDTRQSEVCKTCVARLYLLSKADEEQVDVAPDVGWHPALNDLARLLWRLGACPAELVADAVHVRVHGDALRRSARAEGWRGRDRRMLLRSGAKWVSQPAPKKCGCTACSPISDESMPKVTGKFSLICSLVQAQASGHLTCLNMLHTALTLVLLNPTVTSSGTIESEIGTRVELRAWLIPTKLVMVGFR
eukprot:3480197-Pleurochrysis_carterae.AAC.2